MNPVPSRPSYGAMVERAFRRAWVVARDLSGALALFALGIALPLLLWPDFVRQLWQYLNRPRAVLVQRTWADDDARDREENVYPFARPGPGEARTFHRMREVAAGLRAFDRDDLAAFRDQRLAIASVLEWYGQDEMFRRVNQARHGSPPARLELVTAVIFHLEGLDAAGELERGKALFDALLAYVEEMPYATVRGIAQERALEYMLRHLARIEHSAADYAALGARLEKHLERCETLEAALVRARYRCAPPNMLALARADLMWPASLTPPRWLFATDPAVGEGEARALADALAMPPRAGLAHVTAAHAARADARQVPVDRGVALEALLIGNRNVLMRPLEIPFALAAYLRERERQAVRAGARAVLKLLAARARGDCGAATIDEVDPFTGERLRVEGGAGGTFRIYARGRNGVDEHGGGDDVVVWPPPRAKPRARGAARPAMAGEDGPLDAFAAALAACEHHRIAWRFLSFERPAGGEELLDRATLQITAPARFSQLAGLLEAPVLSAARHRGEVVQEPGTLRSLRYEVPMEVAPAGARVEVVRTGAADAAALRAWLAGLGAGGRERSIRKITAVREGERIFAMVTRGI